MASSADKVVEIVFQGNDRVSQTIRGIQSGMSGLEGAISGIADPLARLGDGILVADAALAALAVGGLTFAYKKSSDFEAASAELAKVLGDEIDKLGEAQEQAKQLSGQYGRSATSVLDATASFKQAGFTVQDAMGLTKASLDLAIAGELEAAQASEILVASLKGFKAPASDAARLVDILNETSNNYATNVEELGIAMAEISPIARGMGFSFEETAGLVTPVIEVFRSGSEASRALRTGLLKLTDDTASVTEALAALGVTQFDVNGNLRSGKEILADVAVAFQSASEADKLFLTQQLVGIDQSARMVEVFDNLAKRTEITAVAMGAAGSAAKEVETRLATSEVAVQRFGVAFENVAITMGDQFRDAATEAVDGGTEVLGVLDQLAASGTFDPLFDQIERYGRELGDFLGQVAQVMPEAFENIDWSGLLDALDDLQAEFGGIFEEVDLTTAEGLGDAIQAVVNTLESLIRVTQGMVQYLDPVWDALREGISQFNALDEQSKLSAGEILGAAQLVAKAGVKIGLALVAIEKSGADIKDVFDIISGSIKIVWNALEIHFSRLTLGVTNFLRAITFIPEVLSGIVPGFEGVNEKIVSMRNELEIMGDTLKDQIEKNAIEGGAALDQMFDGLDGKAAKAQAAMEAAAESTASIGDASNITVSAVGENAEEIRRILAEKMAQAQEEVSASAQQTADKIDQAIPSEKSLTVIPSVDEAAQEKTKAAIKQLSDQIEAEIKRDIAIIEAETRRYEAMVEANAKIRAEEAETARQVSEDAAKNYAETTEAYSKSVQILAGTGPYSAARFDMLGQLQKQNARLDKQVEAQTNLENAMARLYEARAEALENGDQAEINISCDGVYPELEMIMWKIVERLQVRVNEEYTNFLLGIN